MIIGGFVNNEIERETIVPTFAIKQIQQKKIKNYITIGSVKMVRDSSTEIFFPETILKNARATTGIPTESTVYVTHSKSG